MTETGTAGIVSGGHGRTFFSPPQAPSDFQLQGFVNFGDMFCKDFLRPVAGAARHSLSITYKRIAAAPSILFT